MHEWSIAEGIITALLESFKEQKIIEVEVRVGELRDLNLDVLKEALSILSKDSGLENTRFNIVVSKAFFKCLNCGEEWGMDKALKILSEMLEIEKYIVEEGELEPPVHFLPSLIIGYQKCPKCKKVDIEIVSGKELEISKVYLGDES